MIKALNELYARASVNCPIEEIGLILKDRKKIEMALKALEVIIDKKVNVYDEIYQTNDYEDYLANFGYTQPQFNLTEEQYNLIKDFYE